MRRTEIGLLKIGSSINRTFLFLLRDGRRRQKVDLQVSDMLSRLPVKTLIICKSVCKFWRELDLQSLLQWFAVTEMTFDGDDICVISQFWSDNKLFLSRLQIY